MLHHHAVVLVARCGRGRDDHAAVGIDVDKGAEVTIKNSVLKNLGENFVNEQGVRINCDGAVIQGCEISGCLVGIAVEAGSGHLITDNRISRCMFGIIVKKPNENNIIENNRIRNIAHDFLQKMTGN